MRTSSILSVFLLLQLPKFIYSQDVEIVPEKTTIESVRQKGSSYETTLTIHFRLTGKGISPVTVKLEAIPGRLTCSPKLDPNSTVFGTDEFDPQGSKLVERNFNVRFTNFSRSETELFYIRDKEKPEGNSFTVSVPKAEAIKIIADTVVQSVKTSTPSVTPAAKPSNLKSGCDCISLVQQDTTLPFLYSKKNDSAKYIISIKIKLNTKDCPVPKKDTIIHIIVKSLKSTSAPELLVKTVSLDSSDWRNPDAVVERTVVILAKSVSSLPKDELCYLGVEGCENSLDKTQIIRFSKEANPNKDPFWVDLGMNFDLFDDVKPNNFYAGVFMFKKDVTDGFGKNEKGGKRISFTGGVYETKSTNIIASSDSGLIYRDGRSYLFNNNSNPRGYPYFRDTGAFKASSVISNLGIFFSPHYRLNKVHTETNGFHWFVSLYLEMLWQKIHTSFDYANVKTDTVYHTASLDTIYNIPFKESALRQDYRSQYIGIGVPIYIKDDKFSFYENNVFGITNQKYQVVTKETKSIPSDKIKTTTFDGIEKTTKRWNPFLILQFRLTEETIGLSFTGEVRTLLIKDTKPVITLALSKKFDLAKLYNSIVKGAFTEP